MVRLSAYNFHFWENWHRVVITSLLGAILGVTLVTSNLFIYTSLTPFYLYLIAISLFIVIVGVLLIFKPVSLYITWPILITSVWVLYVFLHSVLKNNFNPFPIYLIGCLIFLICFFIAVQAEAFKLILLFQIISSLAGLEALFCIGQFLGIFHSFNSYFVVTGSWENPNVTAMFLAMAILAPFSLFSNPKVVLKRAAFICISVLIIAIFLLQCRTALIGLVVALTILLNNKYFLLQRFRRSPDASGKIFIVLFLIALTVSLGSYFYRAKKASADSRKLIWKLSTEMALTKPLTGYGYGLFAKNYNLFQSQYFKAGNGTAVEARQAGFVYMGYNEFLENAVEGGLPGLFIVSGLLVVLLSVWPSGKRNIQQNDKRALSIVQNETENHFIIAYAGIAAFVVMSIFNFTLQAIPAMCLFVICVAIYSTNPKYRFFRWELLNANFKPILRASTAFGLTLIGIVLGYVNIKSASISIIIKKAQIEGVTNTTQAVNMLNPLKNEGTLFEDFYITYGDIFLKKKNYNNAIKEFSKAKMYTSDPEIYIKTGFCYENVGHYQMAETNYLIAQYIEPNRMLARTALMKMYLKLKDTSNAILAAKEIIVIVPKIKSTQTKYIQWQAYAVLKKLGILGGVAPSLNNSLWARIFPV